MVIALRSPPWGVILKVPVGKSGSEMDEESSRKLHEKGRISRFSLVAKGVRGKMMWLCTKCADLPGSCRTWRSQGTKIGPGPRGVGLKCGAPDGHHRQCTAKINVTGQYDWRVG